MLWTSRIVGAIVGFAVGIFIAEVLFANTSDWTNVVPFVLAVVGWLAGSEVGHRLATRPAKS